VERVKGLAKRTLKGFFSRRNKDKPQEQQQPPATASSTEPAAVPPPPPSKSPEQTQSNPPITTTTNTLPAAAAAAAVSAPNTGKELPPAGPQVTGGAKDAAVVKDTPATTLATSDLKEDKPSAKVSPATSAAAGNSEPVSALDESPPALPPKNDGSAAALKQVETPVGKKMSGQVAWASS
jgi:hypothetical protein